MNNIHEFPSQHLIEEEASEWLVRLDGDEAPTNEELASLKEWINRSQSHREQLTRLARHWDNANILTELSNTSYSQPQKVRNKNHWMSSAIAASIVLVSFLIGIAFFQENIQSSIAENGLYETRIGEQNTITLADGSIIQLNTNSNVQVDYTDDLRSITLLQGEAHFEVSKDPSRPFEVMAGNGKVVAVGTAFAVRLNRDALKVTVTEGKVELEALRPALIPEAIEGQSSEQLEINTAVSAATNEHFSRDEGIGFLEAGQSVEFEPLKYTNVEEIVEVLEQEGMDQALAWRRGLLLFSGEPLTEVVQEINRYSNVKIEINDPAIAEIRVGGQFKVGETEAMLKVLASNFNVEAHIIDKNTIYLNLKSPTL